MGIGVIGCGYWGKNHIKTLASLGLLSAVADNNILEAKILANMFNVRILSVDEMLADKEIKGVVIASNAETHYDLAIKAIAAQKNLLVEKPMALSGKEAQNLWEIASKKQLVFMVGHLLNFHPAYQKIRELIKEIGQVRSIKSRRLCMGQIRQKENVLWSFAAHDIALILGLSDSVPKVVSAYGKKIISTLEDEYSISLELANNIKGEINVSWFHPYKEHKFFVIGEQGSIVFDDSLPWENKVTLYRHQISPVLKRGEIIAMPIEEKYPLTEELLYFHGCIINQIPAAISTAEEGVKVIKIIEAIEEHEKL